MPELVEFYARYRADPRVSFWMVNASWSKDEPAKAKAFLAQERLDLPCAFSGYRTDISFRVLTIPKVIVIDQTGTYRLIHTNYSGGNTLVKDLIEIVDRLLK